MSPNNQIRKAAEAQYNGARKSNPDLLLTSLVGTLRSSQNAGHRGFAAVLLRRNFRYQAGKESTYPRLQHASKQTVKSEMLAALTSEAETSIRNKICDTVGTLGERG